MPTSPTQEDFDRKFCFSTLEKWEYAIKVFGKCLSEPERFGNNCLLYLLSKLNVRSIEAK